MSDPLRLAVAGLGTVGASLARIILERSDTTATLGKHSLKLQAVSARDATKDRGVDLAGIAWENDPIALAKRGDIDVFVELIGGSDGPALESVEAALRMGKSVVTANKALLAEHGNRLARLAEENGTEIAFEAAVAGGIPVIKTFREGLTGNQIERVFGILNGTCNYILTRMEDEGKPFEEILKDAQDLGYAEADPTFDIGGHDTAHKLALLTCLAFGTEISADDIYLEGIETVTLEDIRAADELGFRIKLLGVAQRTSTGVEQRVHPTMVPKSSPIARVSGVTNAVAVDTDLLGQSMFIGPGAGGNATASAVFADITDLARGDRVPTLGRNAEALKPYTRAQMRAHEGGYYIRLAVKDEVGMFARIARAMADANISLESIVQEASIGERRGDRQSQPDDVKTIVLITHQTTEAAIRKAVTVVEEDGGMVGAAQVIRIERLD
ncbi:MAG: homoserine dehydrogenase [Pseudomonadota bacterium]